MIQYVTPTEYAAAWHVTRQHVIKCIRNGRLEAERIGLRTYRIPSTAKISIKADKEVVLVRAKDTLNRLDEILRERGCKV